MLSPRDHANAQFVAIKYIGDILTKSRINEFGSILISLQALEKNGEVPEEKLENSIPIPRQKRKLSWQLGDENDLELINIHVRNKFLSVLNTTSDHETKKMAHSCLIILSRYWPQNNFETEVGGNYNVPIDALTLGAVPENAWIAGAEGRLYDAVNAAQLMALNAYPENRNPFHPMDIEFMEMKSAGNASNSRLQFTKQYFTKLRLEAVWNSFSSTGRFRFVGLVAIAPSFLLLLSCLYFMAQGMFLSLVFFSFTTFPLFTCLVIGGALLFPTFVRVMGVLIGGAGNLIKDAYYLCSDKDLTHAATTMKFLDQIKDQAVLADNRNPWFIEKAETTQIKIIPVSSPKNNTAPSESSKPLDFFSPEPTASTPLLANDTPAPGLS